MPNDISPRHHLALLVAGVVHNDWESFDIDSDLMIPADCWRATMGLPRGDTPAAVRTGAPCELRIAGATIMTGRVDGVDHEISKNTHTLSMNGRDGAAILVDCAAPIFVAKQVTLEQIITQVVRPLGVTKIRIDADTALLTREKINVEPGDTAWAALSNAAEANGLWPWFEPDGTLVVGGPDYDTPPVGTLSLRRGEAALNNNIVSIRRTEDVSDRFSKVTVLGQTHGTATAAGRHNIKATVTDSGVSWCRPKIICDSESDNEAVARGRARKFISDARVRGFTLEIDVKSHSVPETNLLWAPGQRVEIISEPHRIEGVFFLMGRRFVLDRNNGFVTKLRFKEDGVWTLDAHPHKRKHRRGRNSVPGKIVDLSK